MEERRKYPRIKISLPVKLYIDSTNQNAISTNISEEGMQVMSQTDIPKNSSLNVCINCDNDIIFDEYTVIESNKNTSNTCLLSGKFKKNKNPDKIALVKKYLENRREYFKKIKENKNKCQYL